MTLLGVSGIAKRFDARQLLHGVSLYVQEGERIGLIGPNGCGKSTLLRILAGVLEPDAGERTVRRGLRLGYLPQDPVVDPARSVRDVVREGLAAHLEVSNELDRLHARLGEPDADLDRLLRRQSELEAELDKLGGHDIEHRIEAMIAGLGLPDPEALCGPLSGGEKRRVALARLLLSAPELLLLDEPTNHLDAIVVDWLEDWLLAAECALVMVTHDRYFLDRVVHRIIEIDRGEFFSYEGGYEDFLVARADRLEREQKIESSRLNLLRRETAWMRRGPPARTTKAKARISRFHATVGAAREEAGRELEFRIPCTVRLGDKVLRLQGVTKRFGDRCVLAPLDLEIGPGTRLGIVGPNGAGKTTFLRLCTGELAPDAGTVVVGPTVRFSRIDQARTGLDPAKTVLEEVGGKNDYVHVGGRMLRVETYLEQFLFAGATRQARIGDLSGGERNRVLLAKLLAQGGNVLVLDEPTNDLDLATLRTLEEALCAFEGVVLVVSHDRWFLDRVATRVLHLDGAGRARVHEGDLSGLLLRLAAERKAAAAPAAATKPAPSAPASRPKRLSTRETQELVALPDRIAAAEQELARLDQALLDPKLYTLPGGDPHALAAQRAQQAEAVDALYTRYLELEERQGEGEPRFSG